MRRLVLSASLMLVVLSVAVAPRSQPAAAHLAREGRPFCHHRLFTVAETKRAADLVYRGTRTATRRNVRMLGRLERCQRNPAAQRFVRWYDHQQAALNAQRRYDAQFTGYEVDGYSSVFGPPVEGDSGTADGGSMDRPCIAIRDPSTLGRYFLVSEGGHSAKLLHCDSGPYAGGRNIDITGTGVEAMGLDPWNYDNGYATAKELK